MGIEEVVKLCQSHFPGTGEWKITRPAHGRKKECWIAQCGTERYFLKFDVPAGLLVRLGEIGVAPRVFYSGQLNGVSYVIQEFVDGYSPPSQAWIRNHADSFARLVRTYHQDQTLRDLLAKTCPADYRQHFEQDLESLGVRVTGELAGGFRRLVDRQQNFEETPLVPIHPEPNYANMLVSGERLVFLDWDEITLSDPMRDTGLLLWWNFPPDQWQGFFAIYGEELTPAKVDKIYWFAARASLEIALWFAERGLDGSDFEEDFWAALDHQPNPKGY